MAKRQFKLQSVLELKERREEKLQQELAMLQVLYHGQQLDLFEMLIDESERVVEMQNGMLGGVLEIEIVATKLEYLEQLGAEIQRQNAIVNDLLGRIEKKRAALTVALQEKKALEKLKEKSAERWQLEEKRAENKFVDEISMSSFNRKTVTDS